jgi:hypothetical protein
MPSYKSNIDTYGMNMDFIASEFLPFRKEQTAAEWKDDVTILPKNFVAIASDDGQYKFGTGTQKFSDLQYEADALPVWSPSTLSDLTGSLTDMYKITTTLENGQQVLQSRDRTLAKTIGVVDGSTGYSTVIATLLNAPADTLYTVSEALKGMAGCLKTTIATSDNL